MPPTGQDPDVTRRAVAASSAERVSDGSSVRTPSGGRELPVAISKLIGSRLRTLRQAQLPPLSQSGAARRIGISQPALSALEAGQTSPSLSTLFRVQVAYELASLEELFGEIPSRRLAVWAQGGDDNDLPDLHGHLATSDTAHSVGPLG